jgi:hypothetical protein
MADLRRRGPAAVAGRMDGWIEGADLSPRPTSGTTIEVEALKTVAMFCGVGLFVSSLFLAYGLNISPGFF